jgi:hypothetical protein
MQPSGNNAVDLLFLTSLQHYHSEVSPGETLCFVFGWSGALPASNSWRNACVRTRDESVANDSFTTNESRTWTTRTDSPKQEELVLWFFLKKIKQKYGHVNKIYKRIELRLAAILYWLSLQRSQRFSQWEVAMVLLWHLGKQMTRWYRPPHTLTNDRCRLQYHASTSYVLFLFCSTTQLHALIKYCFTYHYESCLV